jgi:hypothetical protein
VRVSAKPQVNALLSIALTNQAKPMIWSGIIYDLFFGIVLAILFFKTRGMTNEN